MLSVLKFSVSLKYKTDTRDLPDLQEKLIDIYKSYYPSNPNYRELVIGEWKKKKAVGIKEHYFDDDIIAFSDDKGNDYFFINQKETSPYNKKTYLIFALIDSDDLMNAFTVIVKDIKKKIKNRNIVIELVKNKGIYMMPCSIEQINVIDSKNHVKLDIRNPKIPTTRILVKYIIFALIGGGLYKCIPNETNSAAITTSIIASIFFIILIDFIGMLLQKKEFYIKDFSDFYKPIYKVDEDPASKLSDSSQSLTPPKFEEE